MLSIFLIYIQSLPEDTWWLHNIQNEYSPCGIKDADIGMTDDIFNNHQGKGVTIVVMADGANLNHEIYKGRANKTNFLDGFTNKELTVQFDPEENTIGQQALGLALGNHTNSGGNVCNVSGIASQAIPSSFMFYNKSNHIESLQYVICHHPEEWDIALIEYSRTSCDGRKCNYISSDSFPKEMLTECLYHPSKKVKERGVHLYVASAGNTTTDVLFSPPTRWPLIFVISGVSSRGLPLNRGTEGTGVFMCAPGSRESNDTAPAYIPTADPSTDRGCLRNMETSNASAAIFAGGLALLRSSFPHFSLADYFYVTAMSASIPQPDSPLWQKNAFGLQFSRRMGFGRLHLGRAFELANKWETVGEIQTVSIKTTNSKPLILKKTKNNENGDVNITFEKVHFEKASSVIEVFLELHLIDTQFGSLSVVLLSPSGTYSELKILTESDKNSNVEKIELPSYEFLGEDPEGTWTLILPQIDSADRGILHA